MSTQLILQADTIEVEDQNGRMAKAYKPVIYLKAPGQLGSAPIWQGEEVLNDEFATEQQAVDHLVQRLKGLLNE